MWEPSKKWKQDRENGLHGIVRFDIFCCQCNKTIAEDIPVNNLEKYGLHSDRPMKIFCDFNCAKDWQEKNNKTLWRYGYTPLL